MLAQCTVRRLAIAFLLVAFPFVFAARVGAQKQLASLKELEAERSKHYPDLSRFKSGQEKPVAADKDKLDAEAKYLVYRFSAQPPIFSDPNSLKPLPIQGMQKYQKEFTDFIVQMVDSPDTWKKTGDFRRQFSPLLAQRFKDVLNEDFQENRITIINCAPMLPHAARLKDEAIGDYLADILRGKAHDAVKLYAARGLRELFPVAVVNADAVLAAADVKRKDREVKYVDALVGFAQRPGGDKLSEPEQNAIRYLRREAIESLAHTQAPLVVADKAKVEGPIAPLLLRVLSPKGGLDPAPNLAERVEAAIGVCQMKNLEAANYNAELGVYLVAKLVNDFADAFNKDLVEIRANKPPQMHWKVHSKRLELALKDLVKNVKNLPVEKKTQQMAGDATILIKSMQTYNQVNQNGLQRFSTMAATLRPASNEVYRGYKNFVVELESATKE